MASSTGNEGASSPDAGEEKVKVPAIANSHSDQNNSASPRPQRAASAFSRLTTRGQKRVTIQDDEKPSQDDDEDIGDDAVFVERRSDARNEVHGRSNSSLHPDESESGERSRARAGGSWHALQSPIAYIDSSDSGNTDLSFADVEQFGGLDETSIVQAVVFLEDGFHYRSIFHKTDEKSLRFYRFYFSQPVQIFHVFIITLLHLLVFVEFPSSLTWTSDIRHRKERIELPCGVTEGIEFACLLLLAADTVIKGYLMGQHYFLRHRWLLASTIVLGISFIDWMVSVTLGCHEFYRFRRILRPYFIIHNSSLMKKTVHCLWKIIPEALNVLLLLALILFIFTLTGMLLFPKYGGPFNSTDTSGRPGSHNGSNEIHVDPSGEANYFRTLLDSMMNLLILLTTANNPDVTLPAYSDNRLFSFFFIGYLVLGLYCVHNMLTAVIYNGFRGYFQTSMQSSFFRRRLAVRAAFEVLRRRKMVFRQGSSIDTVSNGVGAHVVKEVVSRSHLPQRVKDYLKGQLETYGSQQLQAEQFNVLFDDLRECQKRQRPRIRWYGNPKLRLLQRFFTNKIFIYFGILMAFVNVVLIAVQLATRYDETMNNSHSNLRIVNFMFVVYYIVELLLRMWSQGWNHFVWDHFNKLDILIVILLAGGELFAAIEFGLPYFPGPHEPAPYSAIVWNVVRIINMLIMIRVFRVIHHIPAMSVVAGTLVDMVKNFKAFAGVMVGTYYSYALFGMELFHDVIKFNPNATEVTCGTYQQLNYWANNFDDFFAAVVVLWDVMVVNNWYVFLDAYAKATSKWSHLYFVVWWLICCNFVLNLLLALILEHFVTKRDKQLQQQRELRGRSQSEVGDTSGLMSVHDMFRSGVLEPAESQLMVELSNHQHLHLSS